MALATYADLKQAIQDEFGRSDADFVAKIPDFIRLAEQRITYGGGAPLESPPVRIRDMETSADITVAGGAGALPAGFLSARRIYWDGSPKLRLDFIDPQSFWSRGEQSSVDTPVIYTIEGGFIYTAPTTSGTIKALYLKAYDIFTSDNDTNWVLTNTPGVYFYAALIEAASYARDAKKAAAAIQQYVSAVNGLSAVEVAARFSGRPLRPQVERWT